MAERVAAVAAVAEPDVEVAVGTDGELAAVVVGEGLLDERAARARVSSSIRGLSPSVYSTTTVWPSGCRV